MILPADWHIDIFGQDYNSWRIYLLICSIPSVVGLVMAIMLPESPKYLMAIGRPDAALKLLKRMYCMNTRQPANTFPVSQITRKTIYFYISYFFLMLLILFRSHYSFLLTLSPNTLKPNLKSFSSETFCSVFIFNIFQINIVYCSRYWPFFDRIQSKIFISDSGQYCIIRALLTFYQLIEQNSLFRTLTNDREISFATS